MSLIINNIDFDEKLDNAKKEIQNSIDEHIYVNKLLELYKSSGVIIWSEMKLPTPVFHNYPPSA